MTKNEGHAHRICKKYADRFVKRPYQNLVEAMPKLHGVHDVMHEACYAMDAPRALPNGDRD